MVSISSTSGSSSSSSSSSSSTFQKERSSSATDKKPNHKGKELVVPQVRQVTRVRRQIRERQAK